MVTSCWSWSLWPYPGLHITFAEPMQMFWAHWGNWTPDDWKSPPKTTWTLSEAALVPMIHLPMVEEGLTCCKAYHLHLSFATPQRPRGSRRESEGGWWALLLCLWPKTKAAGTRLQNGFYRHECIHMSTNMHTNGILVIGWQLLCFPLWRRVLLHTRLLFFICYSPFAYLKTFGSLVRE